MLCSFPRPGRGFSTFQLEAGRTLGESILGFLRHDDGDDDMVDSSSDTSDVSDDPTHWVFFGSDGVLLDLDRLPQRSHQVHVTLYLFRSVCLVVL